MSLLNKAKAAAEQAAAKAKEGVEDVQAKKELFQAETALGRLAFELVESGEITHARLEPGVAKIRELRARTGSEAPSAEPQTAAPDNGAPPAMPT